MPRPSQAEHAQHESESSPPPHWLLVSQRGPHALSSSESRSLGIPTPSFPLPLKAHLTETCLSHPHQTGLSFHVPQFGFLLFCGPTHNHSPNSSLRNCLKYKLDYFLPFLKLFKGSQLHEEQNPRCPPWLTTGTGTFLHVPLAHPIPASQSLCSSSATTSMRPPQGL